MPKLDEHPTVVRYRQSQKKARPDVLDAERLRRLCLDAGADDVGFVAIGRPELDDQREDILRLFPWTKGLVSIVCRMNREPIRSPARSVSNLEFHHTGERINEVARTIVAALEAEGHRAVNPAMGFPMEMDRAPGKIWVVAHKPVAVAAGLGHMGIHRNVIHPKFGNFILLDTVLVDAEVSEEGSRLDYNPCLECKLCVAACPVGAIGADGHFDFSACYTHNYRECQRIAGPIRCNSARSGPSASGVSVTTTRKNSTPISAPPPMRTATRKSRVSIAPSALMAPRRAGAL